MPVKSKSNAAKQPTGSTHIFSKVECAESAKDGRARKVITRSGRGYRGKFPSLKLGRLVHWESLVERDLILHLEYDPDIEHYQEQPCVIDYYDDKGKSRKYYPDFLVRRVDDSEALLEAKPAAKVRSPKLRAKLAAIALRMEEKNHQFRVMTDTEIRRQPRFDNLSRIHDAVRSSKSLYSNGPVGIPNTLTSSITFGQLVRLMMGERPVFQLYLYGLIGLDLDRELCDSSIVTLM